MDKIKRKGNEDNEQASVGAQNTTSTGHFKISTTNLDPLYCLLQPYAGTYFCSRACTDVLRRVLGQHGLHCRAFTANDATLSLHLALHSALTLLVRQPQQCLSCKSPKHRESTAYGYSIHQPLLSTQSSSPAAVLYFPRGPILHDAEIDEEVIKIFRSTLPYHIIQVDYRLDKDHQHPNAVYDSVATFDWTVENILPQRTGRWAGKSDHRGRLATCGELIGGSLATMLALTECRAGQPGVVAAAVNNPLLDWIDLKPPERGRKRRSKPNAADALQPPLEVLQTAREQFFKRPEDYFDAFASPLLFFRSAGSIPPTANTNSEDDELEIYDHEHSSQLDRPPELRDTTDPRPRSSRQFPSRAHGLKLPAFHITSGTSSILAPQSREFAVQYRQSILRQKRARGGRRSRWPEDSFYDHDPLYSSEEELADADARYLDSQVQSTIYEGSGLWSEATAGRAKIHDMANWLRQQLVT